MATGSSSETDALDGSGDGAATPAGLRTAEAGTRDEERRQGFRPAPGPVTRPPPSGPPPTVSVAARIRGLTERHNQRRSRDTASKRKASLERAAEERAASLGQRRVCVQFGERELVGYFLPRDTLQAVYEWLAAVAGTEGLPRRFSLRHGARRFPLRSNTRDTPLTHVPPRLRVHEDTEGSISLGAGTEPFLLSPRQACFELPVDLRELDGMSACCYARQRCRCHPDWTQLFAASFRSADRDGDGFLTLPEAEESMCLVCSPASPLLAHLVTLLGLHDNDGPCVDLPLFIAMCVILERHRRGRGGVRPQTVERRRRSDDKHGRRERDDEEVAEADKDQAALAAGQQRREHDPGRRVPLVGQGGEEEEGERLLESADFHGLAGKLAGLRLRHDLRQLLHELQRSGAE